MKTTKKALLFFLLLLALKDALLGSFLLFDLDFIVRNAGMTYTNDVKTLATFFGVCVLIVSTLCLQAVNWVARNKPNALFLSKFIAWWMVIASLIVYFEIAQIQWAAIDFVSGALILIPAYLYDRQVHRVSHL